MPKSNTTWHAESVISPLHFHIVSDFERVVARNQAAYHQPTQSALFLEQPVSCSENWYCPPRTWQYQLRTTHMAQHLAKIGGKSGREENADRSAAFFEYMKHKFSSLVVMQIPELLARSYSTKSSSQRHTQPPNPL